MNIQQIRAVVRDVLAHHLALHRMEISDLLRYDRGIFALHNHEERLARMIGELATQVAQGLADIAELSEASVAWAKAEANCDALIDQSIDLAQKHRALTASMLVDMKAGKACSVQDDGTLADLEKKIATVDGLIAFACANVSKREAAMKLLAKQLAAPEPAFPATPASMPASTSTEKEST